MFMTDTDSTALQSLIICNEESTKKDAEYRDLIFEVISSNEILERFDTYHAFCENFGVRDEKTRKKLGLFEIKHIDDPCQITIAVNPKKYIEKFSSDQINKKQKELPKDTAEMDIRNYDKSINSVKEIERFAQMKNEYLSQHRFAVKNNEINLHEGQKCKFAQTNDKRYYFEDGIVSLPY